MTAEPRRILLIRPSALGDVCRTVPVLVSLKRAFPEASIDWLVQSEFVESVAPHPALHQAIPFDRRGLGRHWLWRRDGRAEFRALVAHLRGKGGDGATRRYDLVVDCQGLGRSGFFAWASGARRRVGFANARELGWLGYTERHRISQELHTVDRMLGLVEAMGVAPSHDMRLYTTETDRRAIDPRLAGRRFAVVAPTSRWPGKRWPSDRFARVIEAMLGEEHVEGVAVVAGTNERPQCAEVLDLCARDERVVDLIGRTSVGGLMALIEASRFVLANDSAALHMGVGFAKPLLGLFGPTRIDLVGPYRRAGDVLQAVVPGRRTSHKDDDTGRAMMERISAEQVIDAVRERIVASEDSPPPPPNHESSGVGQTAEQG